MARVAPVQSFETPDHHGSHRDLLWTGDDPGRKRSIDAIIVPTARRPVYLEKAAVLARALDCTLVTLHSKQWTSPDLSSGLMAGAGRRADRFPGSDFSVGV